MDVSAFDFALSEELIADRPATPRESARLMVVKPDNETSIGTVADLSDHFRPGDILVFNDTKVLPARLLGYRGEVKVEVLLHKPEDAEQSIWRAFAKPGKRLKPGHRLFFSDDFSATLVEKGEGGEVLLDFAMPADRFYTRLHRYGQMPLPPYIEKKRGCDEQDKEDYQTVYANQEGSVAAPTAGLHFTPGLLTRLAEEGIHFAYVTLHVGAGTFLPVKVDDTSEHVMHSEWFEITPETADAINEARRTGGRVIAVGTTSLRSLESAVDDEGMVQPMQKETDIFITPGYRFKVVDVLMTNFHLPRSTLFMLVCAFSGMEPMKAAYEKAMEEKMRFYSYGDACLLHSNTDKAAA